MRSRTLVLALVLFSATPALAQEAQSSVDQAKMYFSAGAQAFSAGQFEAAVQAFDEAYRLSPRPAILFSMAQAERRQFYADKRPDAQKRGIMQRAVVHYHQYLDKEPKSGRRAEAAQALAELEPLLAKLGSEPAGASAAPMADVTVQTRVMVSSQTKGAAGFIDGMRAADFPLIEEVTPGKHRVRVSAEGYFDEEREVMAAKGGLLALDISLRERPARLQFVVPDGAQVSVDGRPQGVAPLQSPVEVPSGSHLIAVTLNGHDAISEEITVTRGEDRLVRSGLRRTTQRRLSKITIVVGLGTLTLSGLFALSAAHQQTLAQNVLDDSQKGNIKPKQLDDYDKALAERDKARTAAFVSLGVGAGITALGAVMYIFDQPVLSTPTQRERRPDAAPGTKSEGAVEISAAPLISPGLWGAAVGGKF